MYTPPPSFAAVFALKLVSRRTRSPKIIKRDPPDFAEFSVNSQDDTVASVPNISIAPPLSTNAWLFRNDVVLTKAAHLDKKMAPPETAEDE